MTARRGALPVAEAEAIGEVILADYRRFVGAGATEAEITDSKAFAARQAAARAALAHYEQMRKLAEPDTPAEPRADDLANSLATWRARMGDPAAGEPESDDDGG